MTVCHQPVSMKFRCTSTFDDTEADKTAFLSVPSFSWRYVLNDTWFLFVCWLACSWLLLFCVKPVLFAFKNVISTRLTADLWTVTPHTWPFMACTFFIIKTTRHVIYLWWKHPLCLVSSVCLELSVYTTIYWNFPQLFQTLSNFKPSRILKSCPNLERYCVYIFTHLIVLNMNQKTKLILNPWQIYCTELQGAKPLPMKNLIGFRHILFVLGNCLTSKTASDASLTILQLSFNKLNKLC